eukprot:7377399-Prymnesium_polylepis.1
MSRVMNVQAKCEAAHRATPTGPASLSDLIASQPACRARASRSARRHAAQRSHPLASNLHNCGGTSRSPPLLERGRHL